MMSNITILDGGMGRELHRRGAPFRQPEWSALALMEAPDIVRETHLDFIRAGAQVITTNSYALVPFHIGESRFAQQAEDLARLSGQLAHQAVQHSGQVVRVATSFPPLFASYRPDLFDAQRAPELARPLLQGLLPYADIALAETISSIEEAQFWYEQLVPANKPIWLSFTLDDTRPHTEAVLRSGETVAHMAQTVAQWDKVDAVLFNCSQPEVMANAVATAKQILPNSVHIGVYANAFVPTDNMNDANDGLDDIRADNPPQNYAQWARAWVDAGADMVGGCCGISPEHIAELAKQF